MDEKTAIKTLDILARHFPSAPDTALTHKTPLELLIATMLSAQCTDERINKTTPALFKRFKSTGDYAAADIKELSGFIKSVNFFNTKARSIKKACAVMENEFGGRVPNSIEDLVKLPGVGRKTANLVLSIAFKKPAIAVDTHVKRVSERLGLTKNTDPEKIEADLCRIIPKRRWREVNRLLILHGRKTCKARTPLCKECPLSKLCAYYKKGGA